MKQQNDFFQHIIMPQQYWINHGNFHKRIYLFYENYVLDLTSFLKQHPGGVQAIKNYQYKDITNILFTVYCHSQKILKILKKFIIGTFQNYNDSQQQQQAKQSENFNSILGFRVRSNMIKNSTRKKPILKINRSLQSISSNSLKKINDISASSIQPKKIKKIQFSSDLDIQQQTKTCKHQIKKNIHIHKARKLISFDIIEQQQPQSQFQKQNLNFDEEKNKRQQQQYYKQATIQEIQQVFQTEQQLIMQIKDDTGINGSNTGFNYIKKDKKIPFIQPKFLQQIQSFNLSQKIDD